MALGSGPLLAIASGMKIAQSLAGPKPYFCIHFVHWLNYFIVNIWTIVRALTKISKCAGNDAGPQERKPCRKRFVSPVAIEGAAEATNLLKLSDPIHMYRKAWRLS
jgi:hypothetical protein